MILDKAKAGVFDRPRQDLKKGEIKDIYGGLEEWYAQNVRYIATFWNQRTTSMGNAAFSDTNPQWTVIDEILENYRYYQGRQNNFNYSYIQPSPKATESPVPWIRGQKIAQILDNLAGRVRTILENTVWTVKAESKEAKSIRDAKLQEGLIQMVMKESLKEMEQFGVRFNPLQRDDFQNQEEIEEFLDNNLYTQAEKIIMKIIRKTQSDSDFITTCMRNLMDCNIGRYCGKEMIVRNGRIYEYPTAPYSLILDNSTDDDFNKYAQFIGKITFYTPEELFALYDFDESERQMIYTWRNGTIQSIFDMYTTSPLTNFDWFYTDPSTKIRKIAVITGYWKSFWNPITNKVDFSKETILKADVIGNMFIKNYGMDDNIVHDPLDKSRALFPIQVYIPGMFLGMNRSIVDRLRPLQDKIDALEYKITEKYSRDLGKVYIIKGHHLSGVKLEEVMGDFKRMGFTVTHSSGEDLDYTNQERMVDVLDFTADPNLYRYFELKVKYETEMESIVSMNPFLLGQVTHYVGAQQQESAIQNSSVGNAPLIKGFFKFLQNCEQYKVERYKVLALIKEGREYIESFLSEQDFKYLDIIRDIAFEDLMITPDIEDVIDQQTRNRLLMYAQAWSQNPEFGVTPEAILELETAKTMVELKYAFDKILSRSRMEKEKQMAIQTQIQAAMQQQQMLGQQQMVAQKEQGLDRRAALQAESDLTTEALKLSMQQPQQQIPVQQ